MQVWKQHRAEKGEKAGKGSQDLNPTFRFRSAEHRISY